MTSLGYIVKAIYSCVCQIMLDTTHTYVTGSAKIQHFESFSIVNIHTQKLYHAFNIGNTNGYVTNYCSSLTV